MSAASGRRAKKRAGDCRYNARHGYHDLDQGADTRRGRGVYRISARVEHRPFDHRRSIAQFQRRKRQDFRDRDSDRSDAGDSLGISPQVCRGNHRPDARPQGAAVRPKSRDRISARRGTRPDIRQIHQGGAVQTGAGGARFHRRRRDHIVGRAARAHRQRAVGRRYVMDGRAEGRVCPGTGADSRYFAFRRDHHRGLVVRLIAPRRDRVFFFSGGTDADRGRRL